MGVWGGVVGGREACSGVVCGECVVGPGECIVNVWVDLKAIFLQSICACLGCSDCWALQGA